MTLHRLTQCRAALAKAIKDANGSTPMYLDGETINHLLTQYGEIRFGNLDTDDDNDSKLYLNVNVITIPRTGTNVYMYIDLANQIHDLLLGLTVTVSGVGCLVREGPVRVADLGYVNPEKTIQQATVSCVFLLET